MKKNQFPFNRDDYGCEGTFAQKKQMGYLNSSN